MVAHQGCLPMGECTSRHKRASLMGIRYSTVISASRVYCELSFLSAGYPFLTSGQFPGWRYVLRTTPLFCCSPGNAVIFSRDMSNSVSLSKSFRLVDFDVCSVVGHVPFLTCAIFNSIDPFSLSTAVSTVIHAMSLRADVHRHVGYFWFNWEAWCYTALTFISEGQQFQWR